jgi:AraC-like DNA-binding protein
MSPRTLQRRLEAAGTTYQELLDEVRRQSARRLLANTNLDAGEVAFLLGFEELNSFTRAFHAWEGTTPTRWRESDNSRT